MRERIYQGALTVAPKLGAGRDSVALLTVAETQPILMPRQLGYKKARMRISIKVEVIGEDRIDGSPDQAAN